MTHSLFLTKPYAARSQTHKGVPSACWPWGWVNHQPLKIRNYIDYWTELIQYQNKMETYVALNSQYTVAAYLTTVSDTKLRRTLTKYRLSDHNLAVEVGQHRQTWLPREERLCSHCDQGGVETELHFLIYCSQYEGLRDQYLAKIIKKYSQISCT